MIHIVSRGQQAVEMEWGEGKETDKREAFSWENHKNVVGSQIPISPLCYFLKGEKLVFYRVCVKT